jgi:cellulose synthase/poly-beta-1,6-N-acetylglucosamine synthase-like glycosyltransferase
MLTLLARAIEVAVLALVSHTAVTALWGWPRPTPAGRGQRARLFRVVVPAHDEERVIGTVLSDIGSFDYAPSLVSRWVLADRCTDRTVKMARAANVEVDERHDGPPGKGALLSHHLDRNPLGPDEALVVIDADNRVPPDLLNRFADELDAGHEALQAYLDVTNPDASVMARAGALSYWAGNRMIQQARARLGWPADLGGTGMCLTAGAIDRAGGFGDSITEDVDLGTRLAHAGVAVRWLHDVRVRDEKPATVGVAIRQRARWTAGRRRVARRHVLRLLAGAIRHRDPGRADLAMRLINPGRTFLALLSAVAAVLAATALEGTLLPWPVWAGATGLQLLLPLAFLARDGVPGRYLLAYPALTVLAVLWLPIRVLSRFTRGWFHTPHEGARSEGRGARSE